MGWNPISRTEKNYASVAELVDAPDLGSGPVRGAGSSPVRRTQKSIQGGEQHRQPKANISNSRNIRCIVREVKP